MIHFEQYTLPNGLRVILHQDNSTPKAVCNLMYNVGSKDEDPNHTGFAHLFEHLMFRGTKDVPQIDVEVEGAGGMLNAFTSKDVTNYYEIVPSNNLETCLWLEADRMQNLNINEKNLQAEKDIVTEEFKQTRLDKPYGDLYDELLSLSFTTHSYKWSVIGDSIEHVQNAPLDIVQAFFDKFYVPNNAVLVVAGNIDISETKKMIERCFGHIPKGEDINRNLTPEPKQNQARVRTVYRNIPTDTIAIAFHTGGMTDPDFAAFDIISDILNRGESSRLYQTLVKEKELFNSISSFVYDLFESGLFIITGRVKPGVKMEKAEAAIWEEIEKIKNELVPEKELIKTKNAIESAKINENIGIEHRALMLAYYEIAKDASEINNIIENYLSLTANDIQTQAQNILTEENSNTLYYLAKPTDETKS